ncbi:MAG: hypothetical protein GY795_15625 [Desulfobacterales bacterium]|nr:hypothetical protein [Desulfobacterales bacterium]
MDVKKQIKSLLQQAEIYHTQGLLTEAKERYAQAGILIKKNQDVIKNKGLLNAISKKFQKVKDEIAKYEESPTVVEMPENVQNIIKEKFSFGKDGDSKALEGAISLAKFGQYERALTELGELIKREVIENDSVRVEAAKNIIRCRRSLDSIDEAVNDYQQWLSGKFFGADQLNNLRVFLQSILDKKGIDKTLPQTDEPIEVAESDIEMVAEPEIEMAEPEIEMAEPEIEMAEPEIEMAEPETEMADPEIEMADPEIGIEMADPEVEMAEPEIEMAEPEIEMAEPEIEMTEPEIEMAEPEIEMAAKPETEGETADPESAEEEEADNEAPVDQLPDLGEDILDISSVGITLERGPNKGETFELDVSFQSGNIINLLISGSDEQLIAGLETGATLKKVQFYSPVAMFKGKGIVSSKSKIESGPKQGDYSVDIQIISISD